MAYEEYVKRKTIQPFRRVSGGVGQASEAWDQASELGVTLQDAILGRMGEKSKKEGINLGSQAIAFGKPDKYGRPTYTRIPAEEGRGTIFNDAFLEAQDRTMLLSYSKLFETESLRLTELHRNSLTGIEDYSSQYEAYTKAAIEQIDDKRIGGLLTADAVQMGQIGLLGITKIRGVAALQLRIDTNLVAVTDAETQILDLAMKGILYEDGKKTELGVRAFRNSQLAIGNLQAFNYSPVRIEEIKQNLKEAEATGQLLSQLGANPTGSDLYRAVLEFHRKPPEGMDKRTRTAVLSYVKMAAQDAMALENAIRFQADQVQTDIIKTSKIAYDKFFKDTNGPPSAKLLPGFFKETGLDGPGPLLAEQRTNYRLLAYAGDKARNKEAQDIIDEIRLEERDRLTLLRAEGDKKVYFEMVKLSVIYNDPKSRKWMINETETHLTRVENEMKAAKTKSDKHWKGDVAIQLLSGHTSVEMLLRVVARNPTSDHALRIKDNLNYFRGIEKSTENKVLAEAMRQKLLGLPVSRNGADALFAEQERLGQGASLEVRINEASDNGILDTMALKYFFAHVGQGDSEKVFQALKFWESVKPKVTENGVSKDIQNFYTKLRLHKMRHGEKPEQYEIFLEKKWNLSDEKKEFFKETSDRELNIIKNLPLEERDALIKGAIGIWVGQESSPFERAFSAGRANAAKIDGASTDEESEFFELQSLSWQFTDAPPKGLANSRIEQSDLTAALAFFAQDEANLRLLDGTPEGRIEFQKRIFSNAFELMVKHQNYGNSYHSPGGPAREEVAEVNWTGPLGQGLDFTLRALGWGADLGIRERANRMVLTKEPAELHINKTFKARGIDTANLRDIMIRMMKDGHLTIPPGVKGVERLDEFFWKNPEAKTYLQDPQALYDSGAIFMEYVPDSDKSAGGKAWKVWLEHPMAGPGDNKWIMSPALQFDDYVFNTFVKDYAAKWYNGMWFDKLTRKFGKITDDIGGLPGA
jgi:hypothetical protein